jgi:small subunit ribosomal protein S7
MARRRRAEKREIEPDPIYGSILLAKFINKIMLAGKKSIARDIVYGALTKVAQKLNSDQPLELFEQALNNARPLVEVKSRRIGGATYQVPVEIALERSIAMAMRWIINHSRDRTGKPMVEKLAQELTDCCNKQGTTIKKKDDTHRMAEANKAFAHYKW